MTKKTQREEEEEMNPSRERERMMKLTKPSKDVKKEKKLRM